MAQRQRDERRTKLLQVRSSSGCVIYRMFFKHMEIYDGLLHLILTTCFDGVVKFVASANIEGERRKKVTTLLNMLLKHDFEVLADLLKRKPAEPGYAQFFQNVNLPLSTSWCYASRYNPTPKDYIGEGKFT